MSKQQIFPGSSPNDGTGDTLYQGALKINSNFNEIYTTFGDGTNLYNVTGPQGAIGPQGAQGSQGSQGFQGSQGSQGSQGFQGSQGSQGSQGLQGPQGAQGNQGSQGIVGPQGAQGLQGIVGPQGSQGVGGPQGFLGPQGSQGFQGIPGSNGSSTHQWTTTPVGIHTLSNVGIGTTNSTSELTVKGNVSVSGVSTFSNNFNIDNSIIELSHTVAVRSAASGNLTAYFDESGTATLLHENIPKLITTNEGLDILGTASVTNNIDVSELTTTRDLYVTGVSTFTGAVSFGTSVYFGVNTGFGTFSATSGISTDIDTLVINTSNFKTIEYTFHFMNGNNIQSQKVLVMQNGTTAYSQEYAIMSDPNLIVSIGSTISSGVLKIQATPDPGISGLTTYRFLRGGLL